MTHQAAFERLPDLLLDRDDGDLLAHVRRCHACQRQLFLLSRVDRLLRRSRPAQKPQKHFGAGTRWIAAGAAAAAAVAIAVTVAAPHGEKALGARFVLKSGSGAVVAQARIERADGENESVALLAHGLHAQHADTYLLWTEDSGGDKALVGRFMVNHSGECRARFNLPGTHHGGRFWITPSTRTSAVVAST